MATHSSFLTWKIPLTEEPGRLQSTESQRVRHSWSCRHGAGHRLQWGPSLLHLCGCLACIFSDMENRAPFQQTLMLLRFPHPPSGQLTQLLGCAKSCPVQWCSGLWPTRLLCPWNFPDKNPGAGAISSSRGFSQPRDGTRVRQLSFTVSSCWLGSTYGISGCKYSPSAWEWVGSWTRMGVNAVQMEAEVWRVDMLVQQRQGTPQRPTFQKQENKELPKRVEASSTVLFSQRGRPYRSQLSITSVIVSIFYPD